MNSMAPGNCRVGIIKQKLLDGMQNENGIPEPEINPGISSDGAEMAAHAAPQSPDGEDSATVASQPDSEQLKADAARAQAVNDQVDAELGDATDYPALIAQLEADLAEEKAKALRLREESQRLAAEFQNASKRKDKQVADEIERAGAHLVRRLLPIVDDFDLAFANVPTDLAGLADADANAGWIEGFRQIHKKLQTLLADEGVAPIVADGEFDPALHEAVTSEPSDNVPSGHVIATLRAGYTYKGRVLRPALVRVAL